MSTTMETELESVSSFVPSKIYKKVTQNGIKVFDIPFKISAKYTPVLLILMMCLLLGHGLFRNVIDCSSSSSKLVGAKLREVDAYCWDHGTFLVQRTMLPEMRDEVIYPGVSGRNKNDELVKQRYYKYVWMVLGMLAVLTSLPLFLWKLGGSKRIKSFVEIEIEPTADTAEEQDARVSQFIKMIGSNGGFALCYSVCKMLAVLTPALAWYCLCRFIGERYKFYGMDVLLTFLEDTDRWPHPMDALFPKMANCDWVGLSFRSYRCELLMNYGTQWSFLIYWWWSVFVFILNLFSCLGVLLLTFPSYRNYRYRKFASVACRDEIKMATESNLSVSGQNLLKVNISFGEWLVLNFIKKNVTGRKFRDFIRKLAVTENSVLQIQHSTSISLTDVKSD